MSTFMAPNFFRNTIATFISFIRIHLSM